MFLATNAALATSRTTGPKRQKLQGSPNRYDLFTAIDRLDRLAGTGWKKDPEILRVVDRFFQSRLSRNRYIAPAEIKAVSDAIQQRKLARIASVTPQFSIAQSSAVGLPNLSTRPTATKVATKDLLPSGYAKQYLDFHLKGSAWRNKRPDLDMLATRYISDLSKKAGGASVPQLKALGEMIRRGDAQRIKNFIKSLGPIPTDPIEEEEPFNVWRALSESTGNFLSAPGKYGSYATDWLGQKVLGERAGWWNPELDKELQDQFIKEHPGLTTEQMEQALQQLIEQEKQNRKVGGFSLADQQNVINYASSFLGGKPLMMARLGIMLTNAGTTIGSSRNPTATANSIGQQVVDSFKFWDKNLSPAERSIRIANTGLLLIGGLSTAIKGKRALTDKQLRMQFKTQYGLDPHTSQRIIDETRSHFMRKNVDERGRVGGFLRNVRDIFKDEQVRSKAHEISDYLSRISKRGHNHRKAATLPGFDSSSSSLPSPGGRAFNSIAQKLLPRGTSVTSATDKRILSLPSAVTAPWLSKTSKTRLAPTGQTSGLSKLSIKGHDKRLPSAKLLRLLKGDPVIQPHLAASLGAVRDSVFVAVADDPAVLTQLPPGSIVNMSLLGSFREGKGKFILELDPAFINGEIETGTYGKHLKITRLQREAIRGYRRGTAARGPSNDQRIVYAPYDENAQQGDWYWIDQLTKKPGANDRRAWKGEDDFALELDHLKQKHYGFIILRTRTEHRLNGNYKLLHPNTGQLPSDIYRPEFSKWGGGYWTVYNRDKRNRG